MPRCARKNLEGLEYIHIPTHGISKENIYEKTEEKREIRKLILDNQEKFNINVIAYCIMNNHMHLLIRFKETKDLSSYMHKINTSYAMYYNKRHNRQGYVHKGRFYSQIIKNEKHLTNAIIYIHNNPVKAKICNKANEYEFSSYLNYWKDKKDEDINIFNSKSQYKKMHDIDEEYRLDFERISEEETKEILIEYLNSEHITIEELQKDKQKLYEFCNICKTQYKISNRDLEKIIKVSREKIRRILMRNMPKKDVPFGTK